MNYHLTWYSREITTGTKYNYLYFAGLAGTILLPLEPLSTLIVLSVLCVMYTVRSYKTYKACDELTARESNALIAHNVSNLMTFVLCMSVFCVNYEIQQGHFELNLTSITFCLTAVVACLFANASMKAGGAQWSLNSYKAHVILVCAANVVYALDAFLYLTKAYSPIVLVAALASGVLLLLKATGRTDKISDKNVDLLFAYLNTMFITAAVISSH
ncbi:hypothetical protein [Vibrio sp. 10N.239.312.D08]|uniref:hypothetical protein n=1 Tax=Vibrio sp. 10N.239.312.D08 TaxID=3229978 RepID=UPI00354F4DBC